LSETENERKTETSAELTVRPLENELEKVKGTGIGVEEKKYGLKAAGNTSS
jgi:hypothetical protein